MKKMILFALLAVGLQPVFSQKMDSPKGREIVVSVPGIDEFFNLSVVLKKQLGENTWRRLNFSKLNFNSHINRVGTEDQRFTSLNLGFSIGKEHRKPLTDRLVFAHGLQWGINFSGQLIGGTLSRQADWNFSPCVTMNYLLGLQYRLNDRFGLRLETQPGIQLNYPKTKGRPGEVEFSGYYSSVLSLGVGYRF